jgi:predicted PurR-regulated permease PerM
MSEQAALGVPYPFLLATVVAVLDLVPVAGSVTAGLLTSLVAFTVSGTVGSAVVGFFVRCSSAPRSTGSSAS